MRIGEQPKVELPNKLREASLAEANRVARQTEAELAYTNPEKKPYQPKAEDMIEFVTPAQEAGGFAQAKQAAEQMILEEEKKMDEMLVKGAGTLTREEIASANGHLELLRQEYKEKYLQ